MEWKADLRIKNAFLSVLRKAVDAADESLPMTVGFVERCADREQTLFDLLKRTLDDLLQPVLDDLQRIDSGKDCNQE